MHHKNIKRIIKKQLKKTISKLETTFISIIIARHLNLNEDLVKAIGLGYAPFGHHG